MPIVRLFLSRSGNLTYLSSPLTVWQTIRLTDEFSRILMFWDVGHPGNIFVTNRKLHIALLDFGQTKRLTETERLRFVFLVNAMVRKDQKGIDDGMAKLGIKIIPTPASARHSHEKDMETPRSQLRKRPLSLGEKFAYTMFDTVAAPGISDNPFSEESALRFGSVSSLPRDLFFLLRTIQIIKGLCKITHNSDFSLAQSWSSIAKRESRKAAVEQ